VDPLDMEEPLVLLEPLLLEVGPVEPIEPVVPDCGVVVDEPPGVADGSVAMPPLVLSPADVPLAAPAAPVPLDPAVPDAESLVGVFVEALLRFPQAASARTPQARMEVVRIDRMSRSFVMVAGGVSGGARRLFTGTSNVEPGFPACSAEPEAGDPQESRRNRPTTAQDGRPASFRVGGNAMTTQSRHAGGAFEADGRRPTAFPWARAQP